jgi:hypothetical protein
MTDHLIRGSSADWIAIWRAQIAKLELTHREVDHQAGLGEGYCSKLMCGMKKPNTKTIERMNAALALRLRPEIDAEREAIVKAEAVKRQRV